MMSELALIRERIKNLILGTCNTVGCDNCAHKWPKDSDGNSCSYDYLMMLKSQAKKSEE